MSIPARLKSVLRGMTEDPPPPTRQTACWVAHQCVCGEPLVYVLLRSKAPDFGHTRGLPREFVWMPSEPITKPGVLPLFKRVPLASAEHLEFRCPLCRNHTQVQIASDGGLLPLGGMTLVYVELPPTKKEVLC